MDEGGNIRRIGVAVADETLACSRFENLSAEYPPRGHGIAGFQDRAAVDAGTAASLRKPKQPGMGNVPAPIEVLNVRVCDKNLMP